jgi:hypothetical protein
MVANEGIALREVKWELVSGDRRDYGDQIFSMFGLGYTAIFLGNEVQVSGDTLNKLNVRGVHFSGHYLGECTEESGVVV